MKNDLMMQWLLRASEELGLRIIPGYCANLPDGGVIASKALFPDLGSFKGTLVFSSSDAPDRCVRERLKNEGYTMSTFSEPLQNEDFDLDGYAEMFAEWGWTGRDGLKPAWMELYK